MPTKTMSRETPVGLRHPLTASLTFPTDLAPQRSATALHRVQTATPEIGGAEKLADILRARTDTPAGPASPRHSSALALALQGGGAHGAFTWGVLDRLLEEPDLAIDAISGASAGAINAVALAVGYAQDGRDGARRMLLQLWQRVADLAQISPLQPSPLERLAPNWRSDWSPGHLLLDLFTRFVSPYQFNPFGIDPLRQILLDLVDFDLLRRDDTIRLFIAATRLESGAMRLFTNADLSVDAVLASACLPAINQAIRLDDGYYWDGGYSANPPLLPLIDRALGEAMTPEILLVRIDPTHDEAVPMTAGGIRSRLNRVVFNAPLNAELRLLDWLRRQPGGDDLQPGRLGARLAALRLHTVAAEDVMRQLGDASKLTPDWAFISRLHYVGRQVADDWLKGVSHLPGDSPASDENETADAARLQWPEAPAETPA